MPEYETLDGFAYILHVGTDCADAVAENANARAIPASTVSVLAIVLPETPIEFI